MIPKINKKKKKDLNRMVKFNRLIRSYNVFNISGYLNILVSSNLYCAGMAEWLLRLSDTQCPSGFVTRDFARVIVLKNYSLPRNRSGSIPTPSAEYFNFLKNVETNKIKCPANQN